MSTAPCAHYPVNLEEGGLIIIDTALRSAAYSSRAARVFIALLKRSRLEPPVLMFHRDMILNIPLIVDLELLRYDDKQKSTNNVCVRSNRCRVRYSIARLSTSNNDEG
jgi:hypothetical protein